MGIPRSKATIAKIKDTWEQIVAERKVLKEIGMYEPYRHSPETIAKMKKAAKGRKFSKLARHNANLTLAAKKQKRLKEIKTVKNRNNYSEWLELDPTTDKEAEENRLKKLAQKKRKSN